VFTFFAHLPGAPWKSVSALNNGKFKPSFGCESFGIAPLHPGPSKRIRFLATSTFLSCGSGEAVAYYAHEWKPENTSFLDEFIHLEGAQSRLEDTEVEHQADRRLQRRASMSDTTPPCTSKSKSAAIAGWSSTSKSTN
jgi:hypothetical protein